MYEVKGRIDEKTTAHWLIENAADISEALTLATTHGMYDVFAIHLSKFAEVIGDTAEAREMGERYYKATVKEEREDVSEDGKKSRVKRITYQMLVSSDSVENASKAVRAHLEQGYDLMTCAVAETKIDDVLHDVVQA